MCCPVRPLAFDVMLECKVHLRHSQSADQYEPVVGSLRANLGCRTTPILAASSREKQVLAFDDDDGAMKTRRVSRCVLTRRTQPAHLICRRIKNRIVLIRVQHGETSRERENWRTSASSATHRRETASSTTTAATRRRRSLGVRSVME